MTELETLKAEMDTKRAAAYDAHAVRDALDAAYDAHAATLDAVLDAALDALDAARDAYNAALAAQEKETPNE
jgi:hypothetical protein